VIDLEADVDDEVEGGGGGLRGVGLAGLNDTDVWGGGGDSADAMVLDMSEKSIDARFWLLIKLSHIPILAA
jgi:hypothetical protein